MKTLKDKINKKIRNCIDNWINNLDFNQSFKGKQINYIIEDEDEQKLFNEIDKIMEDFKQKGSDGK